jgi:putative FmdB family regulatory protein
MPLYEYQCEACGHRFERIQKFSDPPLDRCPKCGGAVHKLQSAPAFQFKGSGWYITDYGRKDSGSKSAEPKSDSSSGESSKSSATGETRTEAKAEAKNDAAPAASDSKPTKAPS